MVARQHLWIGADQFSSAMRVLIREGWRVEAEGRTFRTAQSMRTILAAVSTTIAWGPLMRKRISRLTAETLPWYLRLYGVMIGASIPARHHQHGSLCGISREERFSRWGMADVLFLALTGKKPTQTEARPLQILIGLLISNGPGSISAQGAKGAVAADGPHARDMLARWANHRYVPLVLDWDRVRALAESETRIIPRGGSARDTAATR